MKSSVVLMLSFNNNRSSEFILNVTLGINLRVNKNSSFNFGTDLEYYSTNFTKALENELILLLQRSGVNIGNVIIIVDENLVSLQALLPECNWFVYPKDEFIYVNNTVIITSTKKVYIMGRFRLVNGQAWVCIPNENSENMRIDRIVSRSRSIVTLVLITLSIICLVIRLVLQFKVACYASFAGKLHFNLCLALCLVFFYADHWWCYFSD